MADREEQWVVPVKNKKGEYFNLLVYAKDSPDAKTKAAAICRNRGDELTGESPRPRGQHDSSSRRDASRSESELRERIEELVKRRNRGDGGSGVREEIERLRKELEKMHSSKLDSALALADELFTRADAMSRGDAFSPKDPKETAEWAKIHQAQQNEEREYRRKLREKREAAEKAKKG